MLTKLCGKVNDQWHQFGLAIGVPGEFLEKLKGYSEKECLVKLLDYWFRHHPDQPTWKEVADALEDIRDYQLARSIKRVYYELEG